ncbi:NTPase [Campylobacter coli]|nr:NTPase [Campylobacter coli]
MENNQNKQEKLESVNIDKPIEKKEEDLFSRNSVAEQLNTIIKNYKEEDSITFGIISDWGSGRTSFVNMTLEDFKDDENFIIVKFNPWNISTRKKLISDFFTTLAKEICRRKNKISIWKNKTSIKVEILFFYKA